MAQAFFGGVHPHDMKAATNEKAIEKLPAPAEVVIPMSMHFGAPCTPLVKAGDHVKVGQKIGEFRGLGAPIHASVSGTVKVVEPRPYSMGGNMMSVVIENDFQDALSEEVQAPADPGALSVEEMIEAVKNAGIVGMGGAVPHPRQNFRRHRPGAHSYHQRRGVRALYYRRPPHHAGAA